MCVEEINEREAGYVDGKTMEEVKKAMELDPLEERANQKV